MIFAFDYDVEYDGPPFPKIEVTLRNLEEPDQIIEAIAYVDSGADGTIIPQALLQKIGARKVDEMNLRWGSGPGYQVDIYEVLLQIGSYPTLKVFAASDRQQQHILLGRDILNYFVVTLNGLASIVEVSQ